MCPGVRAVVFRGGWTRSKPAIVSLTKVPGQGSSPAFLQADPVTREKTCTDMMLALGATPEKSLPCPAAIPATWVPCWHPVGAYVQGAAESYPVWVFWPFGQLEF